MPANGWEKRSNNSNLCDNARACRIPEVPLQRACFFEYHTVNTPDTNDFRHSCSMLFVCSVKTWAAWTQHKRFNRSKSALRTTAGYVAAIKVLLLLHCLLSLTLREPPPKPVEALLFFKRLIYEFVCLLMLALLAFSRRSSPSIHARGCT